MIATAAPPPVTPGPLVNSLPAWLGTPADIGGELAGVQVFGQKLAHVVRHLERERIDYFYPRERVVRHYTGGRRTYDRAFIPGCFFIGMGYEGRDAARDYAEFMGWRLKFLIPPGQGAQAVLRKEVSDLADLLYEDPTLRAWQGLRGGDHCRIAQGPFQGFEGYVDREETGRHTFWIHTTIFGVSTPLEVPCEYLEKI